MVTYVPLLFIHHIDIFFYNFCRTFGPALQHFCRTFIRNVRLSHRSDEFRHHCHIPLQFCNSNAEDFSWVAIVIPTDRLKSVRNRCVMEDFRGVFVLSLCFLDFSVGVGVFVIGLSQISSFFSSSQNSLFSTCISIFEQVENSS